MITATGYSKDPSIIPEGIAVTFGAEMIKEKGGLHAFLKWFHSFIDNEDSYWLHKLTNRPKFDQFIHVYIIIANRLYGRCYFGGFGHGGEGQTLPGGDYEPIPWKYAILAGPLERCPHKRILRGFQGFRYATQLW